MRDENMLDGGGTSVLKSWGAAMAKLSKVAAAAAVVAAIAIAITSASDTGRAPTVAQSSGVDAAASCGTGNPLHGRTQGVVDAIVQNLKSWGTLTASEDCSDVTTSDLGGISGVLNIAAVGLTQLRANDFVGLTNRYLQRVDLSDNDLVTLPANAFTGMTNLTTLRFQNNRITTIEAGAFNGLGGLATIELNNNRISTLPASAFSGLSSTGQMSIDMPGNEISSLPSTIFASIRLRRLNLNDNYLKSDQLGFLTTAQPNLGNLYLGGNLLTSDGDGPDPDLPTNIFGIHGASAFQRNLQLQDNKIKELPTGVFSGYSGLTSINLSNNRISRLQAGVFNGVTWAASSWSGGTLWLSGNPLTSIDANAFNDGACGSPSQWDSGFNATNCIHLLYLNDTLLESLPAGVFNGMDRLRTLDLSGSRLTTIPAALYGGLTRITEVSLQDNRIASLPDGAFSDLQSLATLDLRGNLLTSLPAGVFNGLPTHTSGANMGLLQRPTTLDVRGNSLSAAEIAALVALFPAGHDVKTGALPEDTLRTAAPDDGTTEALANCGVGHILTGRTAEVVYSIMRGAFFRANRFTAFWNLNLPMRTGSWDSTLARHETRYGNTPSPGDPPAIYPTGCNLMTANDLLSVTSLAVTSTGVKSLQTGDFAGMPNMVTLQIYRADNSHRFRELPVGIFDGLPKLRSLIIRGSDLMTLRSGVFARLTNLRSLDLSYNLLTTLPAGVFSGLTRVHTLSLNDNRLSSLPESPFDGMTDLRNLYMQRNDLDAEDIAVGTFSGLAQLRVISLRSNNFESLYVTVFVNQGLTKLKTLRISEQVAGRSTDDEFGTFEESLPSLVRLDRAPGAQLEPSPTPTPTPTLTPTLEAVEEPIISRIEPLVRTLTITTGSEIRLSFELYNYRDKLDNDLSTHEKLRISWTATGNGVFSESSGDGSNRDGEVNDREVMWRAPGVPGEYSVIASIAPPGTCSGDEIECMAQFIVNVTGVSLTSTPAPTPCRNIGQVPGSLSDTDGNAYSVITPAGGGDFLGDGAWVTVPRGALPGCNYVGIRAYAWPGQTPSIIGGYGTGGQRYSVDVVNPSGNVLQALTMLNPADVCIPLPDRFRASLSDLMLVRQTELGVQELTSKVRRHSSEGFKVCGAVSEFPAIVVVANRDLSTAITVLPTPTPVIETPDAGGGSPNGVYVLLAFVLGALSVGGAMRLLGQVRSTANAR